MAKPKISLSEVSQTFDLKEIFNGISFKNEPALKQAIAQAIIDKIIARTESGVGINGKALAGYSKAYIESDDFKAFGKKPSKVNMRLTGAMLDTLDLVEDRGDKIKIGWNDSEEIAKAYNHNVGDTVRKRPFFGLNEKEIKEIKSEFFQDIKEALEIKKDEGRQAFEEFILEKIGEVDGSEG